MSHIANLNVANFATGSTISDAFNRGKTSEVRTLFDSKQITADTASVFWNDYEASGSGTSSSSSNGVSGTASTTISVGATTAGTRRFETYQYWNYQSGKGQEILITGVFGAKATDITRRMGYFDDDNGVYLEQTSSTLNLVVRTSTSGSPVNNATAQSSWNYDTLDGTGRSGITLDESKDIILVIDFEWLGVGTVRFGFVVNGGIRWAHFAHHANIATGVYMSIPNSIVRYEIINGGTGAASNLTCICSTVMSQGGQEETGITRWHSRGLTAITATSASTYYPIISIRLNSSKYFVVTRVLATEVLCTSTAVFEWLLIMNPTVTGGAAASWVTPTDSAIQYDVTRTGTLSGGYVLDGGYGATSVQSKDTAGTFSVNSLNLGWDGSASASDEIVLGVAATTTSETFLGGIQVRELL